MMKGGLWILTIIVFCGGCSAVSQRVSTFMGGEDNTAPPTPLEEIAQQVTISKIWEKKVGDGSDKQYLKLEPVYATGRIFVADSEGEIVAIDAQTGQVLWKTDADTRITGGPGASESLVIAGTGEAEVITLAADSGNILWRSKVSSEVLSAPKYENNIIVVRTIDGKIFGLDAGAGERLWTYEQTVPVLTLRGTSSPVIAGNYLVAGFDEGRLAAIELQTGKLVWDTRIAVGTGRTELERMVDIDAEPLIVNDLIYVTTFQGRIAAVTLETGRIMWTREVSSYAGLSADEKTIYITDDDSSVWALDRASGNSLWKQDKLKARALTAPAVTENMIVVGDVEGYLHWIDKQTGEIMAREQITETKIIAAPIAVDNVVYVYASDGTLAAYTTKQIQ
ncbi:MAG: outer membrane protein assembly factor BamB [Gammaproteobacteria bacterium]